MTHPKKLFITAICTLLVLTTLRRESFRLAIYNIRYQSNNYNIKPGRNLEDRKTQASPQVPDRKTRASPQAPPGPPAKGPVIAALVANRQKDVDELTIALRSLAFLSGDDDKLIAPVLVFNEGDLTENQIKMITESTDRPVMFPLVNFAEFPVGFDPNAPIGTGDGKHFRVKGRSEWGYYQMIRFWITGIWKHPALEPFGTVMRIDSDSCFRSKNPYLPNFKYPDLVYHSQFVGNEDGKEFTIGLYQFATDFMTEHEIHPANPMLWQLVKSTWETQQTLPVFMTNFELNSKEFMQSEKVAAWHEALTERAPYGIYTHRWGDAVTRFLTAVMFAENQMVMTSHPEGYGHKESCAKEEVDYALAILAA